MALSCTAATNSFTPCRRLHLPNLQQWPSCKPLTTCRRPHPETDVYCPAGSHVSSAAAVAQLHASAHLLQGAAWQLAGSRQLAEVSALQVLANFEGTASTADQCLAYAQLAQIAASKKGYR